MLRKLLDLLSDAAVYGVSSMLTRIVGLLLVPVLTAYLTTQEYGLVAMLGLVSLLFDPIARLGMTNAIFRRFNVEKDPQARGEVLTTGLISVVCSSLVLLAICLVLAAPIARFIVGAPGAVALVRVTLITAAFAAVATAPMVCLRAGRRVKVAAAMNVAMVVISTIVTILLLVVWDLGVWAIVWGTFVAQIITTIVLLGLTASLLRGAFSWATWRRMASYGLPFVPHHLQGVGMYLFGLYMVSQMLGVAEAGLYSLAMKFALPAAFVVNSIQSAWVPYKFQIHAEDKNAAGFFRSAVTFYIAGIAYLWVGVSLWGPEMVYLLTAAKFHAAAWLVPAVALVPITQGVYFMMGTGLELSENTRPLFLVSLSGLLTLVVSAFPLVRAFGAVGAAIATIGAWVVVTIVVWFLSQRRFAVSYDWLTLAGLALVAAMAVAVGYASRTLPVAPRLAVAVSLSVVFPCVEYVVLYRSKTERYRMSLLWQRVSDRLFRGAIDQSEAAGRTSK